LPFEHRHVLDTQAAPRGQLPYVVDGEQTIGDSDAILSYLKRQYALPLDAALTDAIHDNGFLFGDQPASIDAAVYGFVANIYFYDIDTPLKQFVASQRQLVNYCIALRNAIARGGAAN
jgi:glutathione S-transferase